MYLYLTFDLLMLENLVIIVLGPSDVRTQTSEFPHAVHLLIPRRCSPVRMALHRNLFQLGIHVPLVRHSHLVETGDAVLRRLLPAGHADEMLRLQQRIAQEMRVRRERDEVLGGHLFPNFAHDVAIVYP